MGSGGEDMIYVGSITSHCSANELALPDTRPTTVAEIKPRSFLRRKWSVEVTNFFYGCTSMASYMHQPASKLFPSSSCKWSKPQDNARASDPIQPCTLDLPSQFWVPCDFSSPIWGVCSQGSCALAACHESGISFVLLFQTPKNTNYENIFFSVHREKKAS